MNHEIGFPVVGFGFVAFLWIPYASRRGPSASSCAAPRGSARLDGPNPKRIVAIGRELELELIGEGAREGRI